jgi:hypothetical protein
MTSTMAREPAMISSGIRIPVSAEVAWILPEGRRSCGRGEIDEVEFDLHGP